jgi:hypothetical protein
LSAVSLVVLFDRFPGVYSRVHGPPFFQDIGLPYGR